MKKLLPIGLIMLIFISAPAMSSAASAQGATEKQPAAEPKLPRPKTDISRFKGPIGERVVLDNGMVLLVKDNHALPVVTISMIIKAGSVTEPPAKAGLGHLTAGLLTKGAGKMSATDISEAIEFVGGSLNVNGGGDYATAHLTVLKKDLDTGFSLLSKVLISPTFEQTEIDRLKKDAKAAIIREEQEPGQVAQKAYQKMVFGDENPYGRPAEGTIATLDAINRDDIVGFHNDFYVPNNCIMAVVGDITAKEAKALISKYMAEWKQKEVPAPEIPEPPKMARRHKYINRDITQANILMGHVGVTRENPDYYTLYVMNYILGGGGFVSRILDQIRDNMGLAYSAYSYFGADKYSGDYTVGMETKNATAKTAIDETLNIIEKMKTEPVSDKELQDAKDYIFGSFASKMDTNSKIADLLSQVEYYHLGLNYFEVYYNAIHKVTKEDVLKAARKYLHPDKMDIVVVGNLQEAGIK
ncbi:MAG: pitrilysin family protein [Nitrospirota bacterium]